MGRVKKPAALKRNRIILIGVVLLLCVGTYLAVAPPAGFSTFLASLRASGTGTPAATKVAGASGNSASENITFKPNAQKGSSYSTQAASAPTLDWRQEQIEKVKADKTAYCGLTHEETLQHLARPHDWNDLKVQKFLTLAGDELIGSTEISEQIVGATLRANALKAEAHAEAKLTTPSCNLPDRKTSSCDIDSAKTAENRALAAAAPLVKLALSTKNVDAYAAAVYACNGLIDPPCDSTSMKGWAMLEPTNTVPWLGVAAKALEAKNTAAQEQAMLRASQATTYNRRVPNIARALDVDAMQEQSPMLQQAIAGHVWGNLGLTPLSPMSGPVQYCFVDGTIPAVRRAACDKIARLLGGEGDHIVDSRIAAKIGEALGSAFSWNEESIKSLRDEYEVYGALSSLETPTATEGSCEFIDKILDFIAEEGALGTREYTKKLALKSGKTMRQIADEVRAARRPN